MILIIFTHNARLLLFSVRMSSCGPDIRTDSCPTPGCACRLNPGSLGKSPNGFSIESEHQEAWRMKSYLISLRMYWSEPCFSQLNTPIKAWPLVDPPRGHLKAQTTFYLSNKEIAACSNLASMAYPYFFLCKMNNPLLLVLDV